MTNRDTTNPQDPRYDSSGADPGEQDQDKTVVAKPSSDAIRDLQLAAPAPILANRSKPPSRDSLIGTWLGGRFEIIEVVGTGGMSVVYKARQDIVDRFVAIKTLKLQLADQPDTVQRFEREIRSLCKLSHPHIVTVYDCIIEDGQPFIAMDFLDGKSLDVVLRENRRLSPEECLPFLVQICSALDHAHKHGIVHRDLKPSNIMLVGDELEFVKVVDFGLAHLGQENQKITRSGEVWGSPPYMSPEQCSGRQCDGRSDIYSLGVVMYEMLTGKDPFCSEQIVNTLLKHLNEPPPPFPPHLMIPQAWQYIVFKCLEKDPADRYQTMGALKEVLTGLSKQQSVAAEVRHDPPEALPRSRAEHLPRSRVADLRQPFIQTTWFKAAVGAVVLAALMFSVWRMPMHRATSDVAPQPTAVESTLSEPQQATPAQTTAPPSEPIADSARPAEQAASTRATTQTTSNQRPKNPSGSPAKEEKPKTAEGPQSNVVSHHKPSHTTHPAKPVVAQHPPHHASPRRPADEPHQAPTSGSKSPWSQLWHEHDQANHN